MILQELVEVGNVKICDSLLDGNNVVMKVSILIIHLVKCTTPWIDSIWTTTTNDIKQTKCTILGFFLKIFQFFLT